MTARWIVAAVVASSVFGVTVVHADCPRDVEDGAYADARRAFEEKRFDDSVALLRKAYACNPKPVYLGNVARAYEEANRPREALEAWRAYLAVTTDERERTVTEGRISALSKMVDDLDRLVREKERAEEAQRKAEAAARERPASPPRAAASPSARVPAVAWITAAVGAAGLVTGAVLGVEALNKHNAAGNESNVYTADGEQKDARSFAVAANVSFAVGGALAALGATWIVVDLLRPAASTPPPGAALAISGTGVVLTGRF